MSGDCEAGGLRAELDRLLRACVQCGLCLPHCATYLATGDEVQSPRGRLILLAEELAAPEQPRAPAVLRAFDQCLGCHACVSACPSGVSFELLAVAKEIAHRARRGPTARLLAHLLSRRTTLGALRFPATAVRSALRFLVGSGWRRRLAASPLPLRRLVRAVATLPSAARRDDDLIRSLDRLLPRTAFPSAAIEGASIRLSPRPVSAPRVALFHGCANAGLLPDTTRRLRDLLVAGGCEVQDLAGPRCCGALAAHAGQQRLADRQRAANRRALAHLAAREADMPIVVAVEAAGCGLELKRESGMPAGCVQDVCELLAGLSLPPARSLPLRVVYHDPCHARHGQGILEQPRLLLRRIPELTLLEAEEAEACCGSGGPYALLHPELSARMGRRKAERLAATGADLVLTSNPGCLGQIAAALGEVAPGLPILPLTDLLWFVHLAPRA